MRFLNIIFILIFTILSFSIAYAENESKTGDISSINISLFYENNKNIIKTIPIEEARYTLATGDTLKLFFQSLSTTNLYVFHLDNQNRATMFFPSDFESVQELNRVYYIPPGSLNDTKRYWWQFDGMGPDIFYIIVSARKLTRLEKLSGNYKKESNDKNHRLLLEHLKKLDAISDDTDEYDLPLQRQLRDYGIISGTLKSYKFEVENILFRELYVKKITIIH